MEEVPENRLEIEPLGASDFSVFSWNQARQVDDDVGLERRVLEQIRHHHLGIGVPLQLQRNPHIVCRDVLDVEERRQLSRQHDLGDPLDERGLVHRVGNARDVDRLTGARARTLVPRRAQTDGARPGPVDLLQLVGRVENLRARRKIRAFDVATQLNAAQVRVVEQPDERRADLRQVVRRHVGRHADGDAGGAVDQEIRESRRKNDRLGFRAVVVRAKWHGALLDLGEHLVRDAREPAFRVAHRGGAVAVERAEVAGPIDERIPQRERLRHAHQRLVERGIAVRMVAPHHVADDLRALAVLCVGGQVLLPHRVEDAALHRLQPIAHVRKRTRRDD